MNVNPLFVPTLALAILLFFVGHRIARSPASRAVRIVWYVVALLCSLPGMLYALFYLHFFDRAGWFYAFRSLPFTEMMGAGMGLGAGMLAEVGGKQFQTRNSPSLAGRSSLLPLFVMLIIVSAPYAKPLLAPLGTRLDDQWSNNVCLQSTPSTCGPASAATLFRGMGLNVSERTLAKECYSYRGGTENWYIARAFRKRGITTHYEIVPQPVASLPFPAIAGTRLGENGPGHFVTILGKEGDRYIVGDPLVGRQVMDRKQIDERYYLTGFFLVVNGNAVDHG